MNTTTIDPFAAFPDAPTPTTLAEALAMLAETRRLLVECGAWPQSTVDMLVRCAPPSTLHVAKVMLECDRQSLADALRSRAGGAT